MCVFQTSRPGLASPTTHSAPGLIRWAVSFNYQGSCCPWLPIINKSFFINWVRWAVCIESLGRLSQC